MTDPMYWRIASIIPLIEQLVAAHPTRLCRRACDWRENFSPTGLTVARDRADLRETSIIS
jgi:hypothetical protein